MSDRLHDIALTVFSDDWGRHPSSCQHIVGKLLPRHPTLWVNTVGTRRPTLSVSDARRVAGKLKTWLGGPRGEATALPSNLSVISPLMYPGFRSGMQRRFNAGRLAAAVNRRLPGGARRVAITTLPITADLPGKLNVDAWVYYCVDDFSVWPGLDAEVMQEMERRMVQRADAVIAVSPTLQQRIAQMGCEATLMTHGIDLEHWQASQSAQPLQTAGNSAASGPVNVADVVASAKRPMLLFWGLIDTRLDAAMLRAAAESGRFDTIMLVGPQQSPDPTLASLPGVALAGPAAYADLPAIAQHADVLVMPYDDRPVTRAMQPLKFKEYLATGKPVVARQLPSLAEWSDAADLVATPTQFVEACAMRCERGIDESQAEARQRLKEETWTAKAAAFEKVIVTALDQ